jgi:hypothetical protein
VLSYLLLDRYGVKERLQVLSVVDYRIDVSQEGLRGKLGRAGLHSSLINIIVLSVAWPSATSNGKLPASAPKAISLELVVAHSALA